VISHFAIPTEKELSKESNSAIMSLLYLLMENLKTLSRSF